MMAGWVIPFLIAAALTPVVLLVGYYVIVPRIMLEGYRRGIPADGFSGVDGSEGAGSIDIEYYTLYFDLRRADVILRGKAPDALHWQVVAFDGFTRLIDGAYANNSSVQTDAQGNYKITLTAALGTSDADVLDCSACPRGMVIFRIVLPKSKVDLPQVAFEPRVAPAS